MKFGSAMKVLLILVAPCLSIAAQPQTITGKVVGVSDGDTITVLDEPRDVMTEAEAQAAGYSRKTKNCPCRSNR